MGHRHPVFSSLHFRRFEKRKCAGTFVNIVQVKYLPQWSEWGLSGQSTRRVALPFGSSKSRANPAGSLGFQPYRTGTPLPGGVCARRVICVTH